jgi:hypothetical protein
MNNRFYTQLDREPMPLDPPASGDFRRHYLAWARSSLARADPADSKRYKKHLKIGSLLWEWKERGSSSALRSLPIPLKAPALSQRSSYRPPRYFSQGIGERDRRKNPVPISYLLTETDEISQARAVPGNATLLRSLCKGKGIVQQNEEGFVYLDIDNRFISALMPYLTVFHLIQPPYFQLFSSPEGAHIPIISAREAAFHYLGKIKEAGQEISFEIEGLYSIEPTLWSEMEQVWFFKLHSPELEALRRRHFLFSRLGGHSFHIAIAVKPRTVKQQTAKRLPTMRINVAYLAA